MASSRVTAVARLQILGGVKRLERLGYCSIMQMRDIWPFVITDQNGQSGDSSGNKPYPLVRITKIGS